jgi:murein DD-endopeptidase MepM/ murein hydrolase activator NlpD
MTVTAIAIGVVLLGDGVARVSAGPGDVSASAARSSSTVGPSTHESPRWLWSEWPVRGPINSEFGARRSSWWKRTVHTGVDIGTRPGTPVRAPAAGSVAFVGWRRGYGRTIVLDHGHGVQSLYGHLSRFSVTRGQRLERGATIGLTGASGNASGSHLHYEVHVKGRPINPRPPWAIARATPLSERRR